MTENLAGNIASRFDFETDRHHFERRPMLVLDEVLKEFRICFSIILIRRVGNTGTISHHVLEGFCLRSGLRRMNEFGGHM